MNLFNIIAQFKLYLMRTAGYLSIINFLLILLTFKSTYNIKISSFFIVPICIIGAIFVGWLDYVLVMPREIIWNNKKNDIKYQINRIEKDLKEVLKKLS